MGFSTGHFLMLMFLASDTLAWSANQPRGGHHHSTLASQRRDVLASVASLLLVPTAVSAEQVDYSKVQDLLGGPATTYIPEGRRPTYLTEPTDEFKQNESKSSEFKRLSLAQKKKFSEVLDIIVTAPNDEAKLTAALTDLERQVRANGGLPSGISKEEVVKTCRRRKSQRYWPTNVEIAYQDLLLEIAFQQSPNTARDTNKL